MGQDKALLPFGGFPSLAEYQYRRLLPLFSNVYISAKRNKFSFDAPMILDAPASDFFAPTAGLLTVYETLASDFFAISVDTPFVDETVIEGVVSLYEREKADAVIARSPGGTHPMCGIYTMTLLPLLKQMIEEGNHRLNHLLGIADTRFVDFPDDELFFNMNTPAEYRAGNRKS